MTSKVTTMREAISQCVKSGNTVFISGAQHGEPSAAVHEIVRQRIDHLTLVSVLTSTTSLLIGSGALDRVLTGFTAQGEKVVALQCARKRNRYPVFEEYSHFGLTLALLAGELGIPFMPARVQVGSDMMKYNPHLSTVKDPFSGQELGAVKAVVPDVGILHAQQCDAEGNAQKWGTVGVDNEGINASKTIIVTTEKIVDSEVIRRDPNRTIIPGFRVAAVVEQPWGAYPVHLAGCYNSDSPAMMADLRDEPHFEAYLQNYVYGTKDWNEYLEKRKASRGVDYLQKLRIADPKYSEPIISGF